MRGARAKKDQMYCQVKCGWAVGGECAATDGDGDAPATAAGGDGPARCRRDMAEGRVLGDAGRRVGKREGKSKVTDWRTSTDKLRVASGRECSREG